MSKGRRKFQRPLGERRYRKIFLLAVEGVKTEPQYFALFNDQRSTVHVHCVKSSHDSSPPQVLARLRNYLEQRELRSSDEAWLVVDKDQWTNKQLNQLNEWAKESRNHGLAVSNPKFEYWLLLHFEDGKGIASSQDCSNRLKKHIQGYDKGLKVQDFSRRRIDDAVQRARKRDNPPCADWPRAMGASTVYRLVENILQSEP